MDEARREAAGRSGSGAPGRSAGTGPDAGDLPASRRRERGGGDLAPAAWTYSGRTGRDEFYVVMTGTGLFRCGEETEQFGPGDLLLAPGGVVHRFEEFTDDLVVWVVFYGPEK